VVDAAAVENVAAADELEVDIAVLVAEEEPPLDEAAAEELELVELDEAEVVIDAVIVIVIVISSTTVTAAGVRVTVSFEVIVLVLPIEAHVEAELVIQTKRLR
jgi:hypothetical protein